MYFDSLNAVLTMDGHGGYVWSAYAISLLVLALLLRAPWRRQRALLRQLAGEQKRQQQGPNAKTEVK
ncbi:MAG: heme exporter protein CcmD [Halieaceae bacterium]|jgi:heme exporter protein D|nr:heme exporter protein CcmD [Halieaceae bacterium]